jgi:hypothetical protein
MPPIEGFDSVPHLITVSSLSLIPKVLINLRNNEFIRNENTRQAMKNTQNSMINIEGIINVVIKEFAKVLIY